MASTLDEYFDWGGADNAPANETDVDALGPPRLKMKTADDATIDNVNPIPKPAAGTNRSYWKQIYLKCAVAPVTMCNNFKWYTDGSGFGTGISLKIGTQHPVRKAGVKTGYDVATGTIGETGDAMTDHSEVSASTDAFGYISSAPKAVTCGEASSQIDAIGETTNYVVLQAEVINTAAAGTPGNETVTWQWDEI